MEKIEVCTTKNKEIAKKLAEIVRENSLSLAKVSKVYNKFNDRVYREDLRKEGEFSVCNPALEDKAINLTKRYFRRYFNAQIN